MDKSLAKVLSYFLHPAIFPLLGVFTILKLPPFSQPSQVVMLTMALVFCGTYLIPVVISILLFRLKIVESLLMKEARDRRLPYAFGAVSFYFTALVLRKIDVLHEAYLYLLASAGIVVLHLLMLNFFKPSAHMAGIGGFLGLLMAISVKYSLNLLPFISLTVLFCGIAAAARMKLKAHSIAELITGIITGWAVVFLVMLLS